MRHEPTSRFLCSAKRGRGDRRSQELVKQALERVKVEQVMSPPVACPLRADLDIIESLFLETDAQAVVVIDHDGVPRGVITKTDLVVQHVAAGNGEDQRWLVGPPDELVEPDGRWGFRTAEGPSDCVAPSLMSPQVATVEAKQSLRHALQVIECEQVFTLPVVDEQSRLVGMLSARDLVDWLGMCVGAGRRVAG